MATWAPKSDQSDTLPRVTFEGVYSHQEGCTERILDLIDQNRALRRDEEREFYGYYNRATLGFGAFTTMEIKVKNKSHLSGPVDEFKIENRTVDDVVQNLLSHRDHGVELAEPPAVIWGHVLDVLNAKIFGQAKQEALRLSPERDRGKVYAGILPAEEG